jgi:hypothetical protein
MRTTLNLAIIATVSSVALAGCGGGKDNASTATPAASAVATAVPATSLAAGAAPTTPGATTASSPKVVWANQLCTALTGKVKPVQPPTVASTSPSDTQKSLVTFLGSVIDAEKVQLDTLKQVGAPPGPSAKKDWKAATKRLRGIRSKLGKVQSELKATNPSNAKALQTEITALGSKLKILATGAVVTADPTCKALA